MIYLDNASTTQIHPQVLDAMMPYLKDLYGNPGTLYTLGRRAAEAVAAAREQVADFLNARHEQIIFTSGGSEANNLAVNSARTGLVAMIASSGVEHDSVYNAVQNLRSYRFDTVRVMPGHDGVVSADAVKYSIERVGVTPYMVSVMYVNNETGAVNEVPEIGSWCSEHGVLFHTDCVQAAGTFELDVEKFRCDFLSISSHKIHGPKGMGALFVKDAERVLPLIRGGAEQEFGLRGGTENVAGIVGFGAACALAKKSLHAYCIHTSTLKQIFIHRLAECLAEQDLSGILHLNGPSVIQPGKILNIRFDGVDAETLVLLLDGRGVCISAGSACRSHEQEPSRVLLSMGLTAEEARSSIRVSFSDQNTHEETLRAAEIMADCVSALKKGVF